MHVLGSDIAALGSMFAAYAPLHEILDRMSGPPPETPVSNAPPMDAEAEAPRAPAPRKPPTRRSPAKTSGAQTNEAAKPLKKRGCPRVNRALTRNGGESLLRAARC
jgi:hypothetical protein